MRRVPNYAIVTSRSSRSQKYEEDEPVDSLDGLIKVLTRPISNRNTRSLVGLVSFVREIKFFKQLAGDLSDEVVTLCCLHMTYEMVESGQDVFRQGDTGSKFYVILEGSVGIIINLDTPTAKGPTQVSSLHRGDAFGELALLYNKPRAATIRCLTDCHFAVLDKTDYAKTIAKAHESKLSHQVDFLLSLPMFKSWTRGSMQKLTYYFKEKTYTRKQVLVQSGTPANDVFIIKEGEIEVRKEVQTKGLSIAFRSPKTLTTIIEMAILTTGESIGHVEVLHSSCHSYTYVCHSATARVLHISKEDFIKRVNTEESWNVLRAMSEAKGNMRQKMLENLESLEVFKPERIHSRPESVTAKPSPHRLVRTPMPESAPFRIKDASPVHKEISPKTDKFEAQNRLYPVFSLTKDPNSLLKRDPNKYLRRFKSWDAIFARKTIDLQGKIKKKAPKRAIVNIHTYSQRVRDSAKDPETALFRSSSAVLHPYLTINTLEMGKFPGKDELQTGKKLDRVVSSSHSQFRFKRYSGLEV